MDKKFQLDTKHVAISLLFDVVRIEIEGASEYEAAILYEDLISHFKAGHGVTVYFEGQSRPKAEVL